MAVEGFRKYLLFLAVALLQLLLSACPRVIVLEYQPSNPFYGQGAVQVMPFEYLPAKEGSVRPRETQSNPSGMGKLFLSTEIGVLYANALESELRHSGYEVLSNQELAVSGRIKRFYVNWVHETDKTFELHVEYTITSGKTVVYSLTATSTQRTAKTLLASVRLINLAMKDCIEQFIKGAQDAQVL